MIFKDDYKCLSGWIHDYYCDKDGTELVFDINNCDYFICPLCNHKYNDIKRKRAWTTKYRYEIFDKLESYSKKYLQDKNPEYLTYIESTLNYYSLNYNKFPIHNKKGEIFDNYMNKDNRCGRITSQGLNEAMIIIKVINCINNIYDYLKDKTKYNVFHILFPQVYELLKPQVNKIHNIRCYEISVIAMIGIILDNKEMIEYAFNSEYSFYNQLDKGVTKDYFWFEGSFHYHFFVLKPILELLKIAKKYNYDIPEKYFHIAKMMLIQSHKCSFSDCSLPSPNDGWPSRNLIDYIEVFKTGNELFNNDFNDILNSIITKNNNFDTIHFFDTGFSIIKNEFWEIFIKYKDNNTSHSHPDKLNIEIKQGNSFFTHDLSTSGYGSSISNEFYKKTYSHNTIVIDGKDQNLQCYSNINSYSENMIDVTIEGIYDNVKVSRKIELYSNHIVDEIFVQKTKDQKVDCFFHCDAELMTEINYYNIEDIKEYPYLINIRAIDNNSDSILLKWKINKKIVINKIYLKNKRLYIGESPNNPDEGKRITLLIRDECNITSSLLKMEWILI